nr:hypothetical protein CFP56_30165 [Quercus suber]
MERKTVHAARSHGGSSSIDVSTATSTTTDGQHVYLRNQDISAIKHWSASVPSKAPIPCGSNDYDAVVQAYQQAKVDLFQRSTACGYWRFLKSSRQTIARVFNQGRALSDIIGRCYRFKPNPSNCLQKSGSWPQRCGAQRYPCCVSNCACGCSDAEDCTACRERYRVAGSHAGNHLHYLCHPDCSTAVVYAPQTCSLRRLR